jgi:hypothetical protein
LIFIAASESSPASDKKVLEPVVPDMIDGREACSFHPANVILDRSNSITLRRALCQPTFYLVEFIENLRCMR